MALAASLFGLGTTRAEEAPPSKDNRAKLVTDDQKTLYALGMAVGGKLSSFSLKPAEIVYVTMGLADALAEQKPQVDMAVFGPKIDELRQKRASAASAAEKSRGLAYLEKTAKEPKAVRLPSGPVYVSLKEGSGPSPTTADTIKVHYRGTFLDGREFDSSYGRGEPAVFPLANMISCWKEVFPKLRAGAKAKLVCPSDLAYGDAGRPGIPGGSTLVFEIELLEVVKK
ncbi:MAG: FKBP-type peptidyl-prolyl cis-trans isomerase [Elusimicrobia bacterium]|nr:FKBP-type peptidyl-prolyl cis-trans isomerase [Elusimicrobiota bacterium]